MGKFNSANNTNAYQVLAGALDNGEWAMPAYFNGTLYYGGVNEPLQAFAFSQARLVSMPSSSTSESFGYPGTTPSISANGTSNAIVWAVAECQAVGVLHAYDATNLATELYNSSKVPARQFLRQQVHHADDRQRQSLRRHAQQRGRVRTKALSAAGAAGWLAARKRSISACSSAPCGPNRIAVPCALPGVDLDRLRRLRQPIQDFRLLSDQRIVGRGDEQYRRANVADRVGHDQSAEAGRRRDADDSRDLLARGNQDCGLGAETRAGDEDARDARDA